MRKKVTIEQERTFCDVCGKEMMGYVPQIVSLYNTDFSYEYPQKGKAYGKSCFNTEFNTRPKKDICISCIEKAINKALEDLYKKEIK